MQADEDVAEILASTYHELREGISSYGHRIDKPAAVMSTAEAVSVYYQTMITLIIMETAVSAWMPGTESGRSRVQRKQRGSGKGKSLF